MPEQKIKYLTSPAERRAKEKWQRKNKVKTRYYNYKSQAKKFIVDYADENDLSDLQKLIEEELKNY